MSKIKTVLLCGFLGAGKTSLLSNILNDNKLKSKKIAILVNDFGALPIDAELVAGNHFVAKINRGNIFCVCVKADLMKALEAIADNIKPDILLIEATGLAEPSDFSSLLVSEKLKEQYTKDSIYCVVDALNFHKLYKIMTAPVAQVQLADVVVINKIDLVDENKINETKKLIQEINPNAKILTSQYSKINFELIGNSIENSNTLKRLLDTPSKEYERFDFTTSKKINKIKFYQILEEYRNYILRAKGVVEFDTKRLFIDIVNGQISTKPIEETNLKLEYYKTGITFILKKGIFKKFKEKILL